jgi:hypothetical protein
MVKRLKPGRDAFTGEATGPAARRADIIAEIRSLEDRQARPLREAFLGEAGATERVAEIQTAIAAKRAELAAL